MTDTTTARRQLLALLLDRMDRDALLPAERPLLRACVTAEMGHGQAMIDQYAADAPWLKAATEDLTAETRRSVMAETAIDRVRELAERWAYVPGLKDSPRTSLLRALDGPSPTPDARRRGTRRERVTAALLTEHYRRARERIVASPEEHSAAMAAVALDALDGQTTPDGALPTPDDAQATADRAALGDAIARLREQTINRAVYGDRTGQMLGVLAGNQAPGTLARCSPLVNVNCPGHQGPPYCDRAPSRPDATPAASDVEIVHTNDIPTDWAQGTEPRCPAHYIGPPPELADQRTTADYVCERRVHSPGTDHAARLDGKLFSWTDAIAVYPLPAWVPDDSRPCPTQFPDGDCAGTWQHPGDCTTNPDDIPSTQEIDAPSEPQP